MIKKRERKYAFRKEEIIYPPPVIVKEIKKSTRRENIVLNKLGHNFKEYNSKSFCSCVVCYKVLSPFSKNQLLICSDIIFVNSECSLLLHKECLDLLNSKCSISDETFDSNHSLSEHKGFKLLYCRHCGKTIPPFRTIKFKCSKCLKVIHEKCLKKVSKNCENIFDMKSINIGEIGLKIINRYSCSANSHIGILIMEIQNLPCIYQTGLYECSVKISCKPSFNSTLHVYHTKILTNTRKLIWNELLEIEIQPNTIEGYVKIDICQGKGKNPQITGGMTLNIKELINIIEPQLLWFKILPNAISYQNYRIITDMKSQIMPILNKLKMSGLKKVHQEKKNIKNFIADERYPTLQDFKLLKLIGRGGFSKVYQCECTKKSLITGILALKVIKKDFYHEQNNVSALRNELKILSIDETNTFIISLNICFQTREYICLVFDFIGGGDLEFHLGLLKKLNESETMFYVCEVVEGLIFLHHHEIIYRDLKPENIMLQKSGHIKLIDFSVSKPNVEINKRTFTLCGTLEYIPPELLFENGVSFESDWWSLGIMMVFMLTAEFPFTGKTVEEIFNNIKYENLNLSNCIKDKTRQFISSLLSKDPYKRIGHGLKGDMYLRAHSYFDEIDWNCVRKLKIQPPIIPRLEFPDSAENFDKELTDSVINFTPPNEEILELIDEKEFSDLNFMNQII